MPVDEALQLRPSLEHLDRESSPPCVGSSAADEEEDVKPQLQAVKVHRKSIGQQLL